MRRTARGLGIAAVADGSNADDVNDYRPGARAKKRYRVRSPLQEAGLTKDDIRALSKKRKLATWNKPAFACLASRIPYGETITAERLARIGRAEDFLRDRGFPLVRVRDYGTLCRIEVAPGDIDKLVAAREAVAGRLKKIGYLHVTLDLEGYRMGSMNRVLARRLRT
jgi:pyridinium-3,5-biscarboxylic acid mononucleotide sulfurtransferase